jgi:AbrB family looped-hinge helix DNA binding protein
MVKTTISSKGQIAIPKAIRESLNLTAGSEVSIEVRGQALVLKRFVKEYPDWRTMRGMAPGPDKLTEALEQEHRDELAREDAKLARP